MKQRSFIPEIFAISLAAILLEISYTRIFSFKIYYYFTYVIIGIGLLGLGAGGVALAISRRLRDADPERLVSASSLIASASVLAGYFAIAPAPLNVSELSVAPVEIVKLLGVCGVLLLPFLAVGLAISRILSACPDQVGRLYGADLLGAALACVLCVPLLRWLTPPGCVMASGGLLALASLRRARPRRAQLVLGVALAVGMGTLSVARDLLPDPVVDRVKQLASAREAGLVIFSRWDPVFRVDVAHHPLQPEAGHMIYHDGQLGSGLPAFDGDLTRFEKLERGSRSLPFSVLPPSPRVLVIGSAGGQEIIASLYFGASKVTAVELNPVTVSLLTDHYAEFTGGIARHPRVTLRNGEGRSFLQQSDEEFDLIWLVAPDSYAAMNAASSGAFVLTESYLYTTEMLEQAMTHLSEGGIVAAQFGERDYERRPNRTTRYLATARAMLEEAGVSEPGRHVMVATGQAFAPFSEATVLVGRSPFSAEQRRRFLADAPNMAGGTARYAWRGPRDPGPVGEVLSRPSDQLAAWFEAQPYDLRPVRDEAPFFWHFVRFRDALRSRLDLPGLGVDWEEAIGEQVLLVLLATVTVLAAALLGLPFLAVPRIWREIPYKGRTGLYFSALGLGFMFFEVCLIQMLTLFLGYPTYSLSVTLFGLLVFSGIGSLASDRWTRRRNPALLGLLGALALLVALESVGLPLVMDRLGGSPLALRVGAAVLAIAPLGLCLGSFMPIGLRTLAGLTSHGAEYVAWGWAVNGFFSVISSVLSTILAMSFGFQPVLIAALCIYAVGAAALAKVPEPPTGQLTSTPISRKTP